MIQTLEWPPNGGIIGGTIGGFHGPGCSCYSCTSLLKNLVPQVDFRYEIEMAGVKRENISVKLKSEIATVTWTDRWGSLKNQTCFIGGKYYDIDKLSIKYEDGLLTVTCPLKEQPPAPPEPPEINIEIK